MASSTSRSTAAVPILWAKGCGLLVDQGRSPRRELSADGGLRNASRLPGKAVAGLDPLVGIPNLRHALNYRVECAADWCREPAVWYQTAEIQRADMPFANNGQRFGLPAFAAMTASARTEIRAFRVAPQYHPV
jgi:hypothetical protein